MSTSRGGRPPGKLRLRLRLVADEVVHQMLGVDRSRRWSGEIFSGWYQQMCRRSDLYCGRMALVRHRDAREGFELRSRAHRFDRVGLQVRVWVGEPFAVLVRGQQQVGRPLHNVIGCGEGSLESYRAELDRFG